MSEMSQAQQPASGGMDLNPTDDMVPPGARDPDSPRTRAEFDGREDVLPHDHGAEDVAPQDKADTHEPAHPAGVPMPRTGEEGAPPARGSSDPRPDGAGQGDTGI
jgi:hypothetical protein